MKKYIPHVLFILLFLDLLYIKAYFYGLINIDSYFSSIASLIPGNISFYLFLPFYYLFFIPINWLLFSLFKLDKIYYNPFLAFSLDIFFTTVYLIILFFVSKKFLKKIFCKKKKSIKRHKKM